MRVMHVKVAAIPGRSRFERRLGDDGAGPMLTRAIEIHIHRIRRPAVPPSIGDSQHHAPAPCRQIAGQVEHARRNRIFSAMWCGVQLDLITIRDCRPAISL